MTDETEISVTHDALIDNHEKWAAAEKNAASDAGESRQKIGAFAEKTGVENKTLSQIRAGLKIKNDGKRRDWLRSMQIMLPMAADPTMGNEPGLPLEPEKDTKPVEADVVWPFDPEDEGLNAAVDEVAAE